MPDHRTARRGQTLAPAMHAAGKMSVGGWVGRRLGGMGVGLVCLCPTGSEGAKKGRTWELAALAGAGVC